MKPQVFDVQSDGVDSDQALIDFEAGLISRFDLRCFFDDDQIELLQVERRHRSPLRWNGVLDTCKQRWEWDITSGWGLGIRRYDRGLEQMLELNLMWISIAWAWFQEGHVSHYSKVASLGMVERLILAVWGGQVRYDNVGGKECMSLTFPSRWSERCAMGGAGMWRAIATKLSPAAKAVQPEVE